MKRCVQLCLIILFALTLCNGAISVQTTQDALHIWFEKLVPSLFVSMVLVRILYKQEILQKLPIPFVKSIFHMDKDSFCMVLCTLFLGFPSGACFLDECYANKELTKKEAQRLLYTCSFATPSFIILSCGVVLFQSVRIGFLLFLAQVTSGLCLLFFTRKTCIVTHHKKSFVISSISKDLSSSIMESGKILYMIGGYLLFFMCCANLLFSFLPISLSYTLRILSEFSSGIMLLNTLSLSSITLQLLTCMVLSFGGFCVHLQVYSLLEHLPFSYPTYLRYRLLQSVLSALIYGCFLL
ncbi:MAG: hypothetical protein RR537_01525 [Longicatena sp.]